MTEFKLRLFVTGKSHLSERAITNLRRICAEELGGKYRMEIIDVLEQPHAAEQHRILATPVVIKDLPPPLRRVVGDLSNSEKVIFGLDLSSVGGTGASTAVASTAVAGA